MTSVTVGFNPDFAPFAAVTNGAPKGIAIERTIAVLDAAGLSPQYEPIALPDMEAQLHTGAVEALAGVGLTADRSDRLDFSRPLSMTGGAWFAPINASWPDDEALTEHSDHELRVVTPAAGPLAGLIRRRYAAIDVRSCTDYEDALAKVMRGEAEAAALNWQVGWLQAQRDHPGRFALPEAPFVEVPLAIAVVKGDPTGLLARLNPHFSGDWATVAAARPR